MVLKDGLVCRFQDLQGLHSIFHGPKRWSCVAVSDLQGSAIYIQHSMVVTGGVVWLFQPTRACCIYRVYSMVLKGIHAWLFQT
jgi:hypothetical protein